jgi:hypothetical protein
VDSTANKVADATDHLLVQGLKLLAYEHIGIAGESSPSDRRLFTVKFSLLDLDIAPLAILNLTRVSDRTLSRSRGRDILVARWSVFESMDEFDRTIAIELARARVPVDIGERLGVSSRTIESHRGAILRKLELENLMQLGQLMARFQWFGFDDYGL